MNLHLLMRKIRNGLFVTVYNFFSLLPLKSNKILFTSESRSKISGNLQYIYEELKSRNLSIKIVLNFRDKKITPPSLLKFIVLAYHCATSKFIIIDDFYPRLYKIRVRKKANFMQVWHAVGAFKQFGYARVGLPDGYNENSRNHKNYSQVIVNSRNIIDIYSESFRVNSKIILPLGVARTDFFFNSEEIKKSQTVFYKKYPQLKNKKIIMFAPTFRGGGQMKAFYPMDWINLELIYNNIKNSNYIFAFKFHPYVKEKIIIPPQMKKYFIDLSQYREINELLVVSNTLITDYSSSIFEYSLLGRKMIFYAPDLEEYNLNRSFYFDYREFVPGNVHTTFDTLIKDALNNDYSIEDINNFKEKFFDYLDGKSSKRVVDYILTKIATN